MRVRRTLRGFAIIEFKDQYLIDCSLQKSSLATADCVWLGVDGDTGSTGHTRMHLTRTQVKRLLPHLQAFVDTGELYLPPKDQAPGTSPGA